MNTADLNQASSSGITIQKESNFIELNVTLLSPTVKHATVLKCFDALQAGQTLCILNDHDPKPLYYQMIAERGNVFTWKYQESGPVWWKVLIQKNRADEGPSIGELAAADIRKAEVFRKYGLDFCCGGKKSLKQACEEKNIDIKEIQRALLEVSQEAKKPVFNFNNWKLDFLADYIYNEHHQYWYKEEPTISQLVQKVAEHHGATHAELMHIQALYKTLRHELNTHFLKEEKVLFPFIKQLVQMQQTPKEAGEMMMENIDDALQIMEADHEAAGNILSDIRNAANNFTAPPDACNSFKLLYNKFELLEEDLHQHIHLENNILFPKAAILHKQLIN